MPSTRLGRRSPAPKTLLGFPGSGRSTRFGPGSPRNVGNVPSADVAKTPGLTPVGEGDHVIGAEQPDMTIVEYGDFGCPFCFAARRPLESLLERFAGLRLVWRHFPDPELHPGADLAAELSELAASEGRFWEAYSLLLGGHESFTADALISVGLRLDLERAAVESALRDRAFRDRVEADVAGGRRAGVHGTPTFFVDGVLLVGHWRQLAQIVPEALSEHTA
jgi:protein-disulfide isomerase